MSRRYEKMLMGPFYPGMYNRDKVDCPALPETPQKCGSDENAEAHEKEMVAWQAYFDGKGPKPE